MAIVAEVSKGDVPPRNPYYLNDDLHYYWLMYLLPSVEHRATSLRIEKGEDVPRSLACARLLDALDEWLALHDLEGFAPVRDRFRQLSSTLGRRVRVELEPGVVEGDAVDLGEDGALIVRTPDEALTRVMAGDVTHCKVL
jgi:BirA family biotin operon repressor/biotin-[acetyl-CoA-carboxylase] ligase